MWGSMINIHLHIEAIDQEVLDRLEAIELALRAATRVIRRGDIQVQQALQELEGEVSRNTSVDESGALLLARLADLIEQSAGDPAAVRDLAGRLRASNDALAAAITAHTPAETPPTEPPAEPPPVV